MVIIDRPECSVRPVLLWTEKKEIYSRYDTGSANTSDYRPFIDFPSPHLTVSLTHSLHFNHIEAALKRECLALKRAVFLDLRSGFVS